MSHGFVSDLDGTLLRYAMDQFRELDRPTTDALSAFGERGWFVALLTGGNLARGCIATGAVDRAEWSVGERGSLEWQRRVARPDQLWLPVYASNGREWCYPGEAPTISPHIAVNNAKLQQLFEVLRSDGTLGRLAELGVELNVKAGAYELEFGMGRAADEHISIIRELITKRISDVIRLGPLASCIAEHWPSSVSTGVEFRAIALDEQGYPCVTDKGTVLREIQQREQLSTLVYAGDDKGDLPAFEAVAAMEREGIIARGVTIAVVTARTPGELLGGATYTVTEAARDSFLVQVAHGLIPGIGRPGIGRGSLNSPIVT